MRQSSKWGASPDAPDQQRKEPTDQDHIRGLLQKARVTRADYLFIIPASPSAPATSAAAHLLVISGHFAAQVHHVHFIALVFHGISGRSLLLGRFVNSIQFLVLQFVSDFQTTCSVQQEDSSR